MESKNLNNDEDNKNDENHPKDRLIEELIGNLLIIQDMLSIFFTEKITIFLKKNNNEQNVDQLVIKNITRTIIDKAFVQIIARVQESINKNFCLEQLEQNNIKSK